MSSSTKARLPVIVSSNFKFKLSETRKATVRPWYDIVPLMTSLALAGCQWLTKA